MAQIVVVGSEAVEQERRILLGNTSSSYWWPQSVFRIVLQLKKIQNMYEKLGVCF